MNWRKSVLLKKTVRYSHDALRYPCAFFLSEKDYSRHPPIIANSFPKSGTHLLIQILQAMPGIRDWGLFLASTPSFTFREIPDGKMCRRINKLVPNELVSAHLYYSEQAEKALGRENAVHYFIYRDPRDIVISEAHYLTYMNKWHRLHRYFRALPDMKSRIMFSIQGATDPAFPYDYPNISKRFLRYKPWINHPNVLSIKFEKLVKQNPVETVRKIIGFYMDRANQGIEQEELIKNALTNINPQNSHTFRKGRAGGWKEVFTDKHKEVFKECAGRLLVELGYETDLGW